MRALLTSSTLHYTCADKACRISIPLIWAIAAKTSFLSSDPMLWFSMMLMPTGPPAMILAALTDVTGAPDSMKMTIAKFLTVRISCHVSENGVFGLTRYQISYAITPMICFTVVGALKATEAIVDK